MSQKLVLETESALAIRSRAQPTNNAFSAAQPRPAPKLSQFPRRFNMFVICLYVDFIFMCHV